MDQDQGGHGFQRVRTYLGPSLGWVDEQVQPTTHITTGGLYTIQPGDSVLLVDVAAGVTIQLPDVRAWMQQRAYQPGTAFDRSITVKDFGGNAFNFNIVVAPFGNQTLDNIQTGIAISVARSTLKLLPLNDQTGWITEIANVGGAGGGGGGDVFKAGNNTFTGINNFQSTITAPTPLSTDNSTNVATTAWVVGQNYLTSVSLTGYAPLLSPVFIGTPTAPTPTAGDNTTNIATTAFVENAITGFQPLDADLTAIAALTGTNTIYYRSSAAVWSPVVIGGGLTFSGGILSSSAGGGNVSSVGTPLNGQIAQWTSSTQIQGVTISGLGFAPINSPVFTGNPQAPVPPATDNTTSIPTTSWVHSNYQPLNADLTAISGLLGTNTIYYRSGTATWSAVGLSGLTFAGGVLSVNAAIPGGVNNSVQYNNAGALGGLTPLTNGQLLIGSTGTTPVSATLTAGANITITNGPGTISIAGTASPPPVAISDAPPPSPVQGELWWQSSTGAFLISYNDGNSTQWVGLNGVGGTPGISDAPSDGHLYGRQNAAWAQVPGALAVPGQLSGLTLAYVSGNTMTIAPGGATSDDATPVLMVLSASMTKLCFSPWALGSTHGALDTGTVATSTWYHVWLIMNTTSGAVDVLTSLSSTAPTLPSGYNKQRRIGSIKSDGSTNLTNFSQFGDEFIWITTPGLDVNVTNPGAAAVSRTMNVPTGVKVWVKFVYTIINNATGVGARIYFTELDKADEAPALTTAPGVDSGQCGQFSAGANYWGAEMTVRTNTAAQIRSRFDQDPGGGTLTLYMTTRGWIDYRGK